jgi:sugar phosphate isomerase/epimerase
MPNPSHSLPPEESTKSGIAQWLNNGNAVLEICRRDAAGVRTSEADKSKSFAGHATCCPALQIAVMLAPRTQMTKHPAPMKSLFLLLFGLGLNAQAADLSGDFQGPLGLQLYTLRESFKTNVLGTLDKVKALGFAEIEGGGDYGLGIEPYNALLRERGLTMVSAGFGYEAMQKDIAGAVSRAQAFGVKFVMCAWIPHTGSEFTEAEVRRAAAHFNTWGAAFKAVGITFTYHPHGYEFLPLKDNSGRTHFDLLAAETKPEFVSFEMDVFWVTHPGQDPVKLLAKYPNRWALMHLKDIRRGAPVGIHTGHAPSSDDVPLGTGQVNWPAVLKQAAAVGVKHYFIEDESAAPLDALPVSVKYLQNVKF